MQILKKTQFTQCFFAMFMVLFLSSIAFAQATSNFTITLQPSNIVITGKDSYSTLFFGAEHNGDEVSYQWYQTYSDPTKPDEPVASGSVLPIAPLAKKEIRFYYCIATSQGESVKSNVAAVAYTGLPTLFITTPNAQPITSKEVWVKNATISLQSEKEEWNFTATTSIRGRGNSTWGGAKKPYALKLDSKQEIMGMPKHKRWVLLANYYDNSFLKNHIAFYLSKKFKMDYTVRGEFVDVYLNGQYNGLYWLGEAIKVDENRVNINDGSETMSDDEDKDFLVEMDSYFDEEPKFRTPIRKMPYMIKNEDYMVDDNGAVTAGGSARLTRFSAKIGKLERMLYPDYVSGMNTNNASAPDEHYTEIIDVDSWAKFWMVNELMDNIELQHPKSCYFTYQNDIDLFKAGPVWDFDWGLLQEQTHSLRNYIYYDALFKSPLFQAAVRRVWDTYSGKIDTKTEIEKMREYLRVSSVADSVVWGIHYHSASVRKASYDQYVDFVEDMLDVKKDLIDKFITDTLPKVKVVSPILAMESDSVEYSGVENKPVVTVIDGNDTLKEGTDYVISFYNNIELGTASLEVIGQGNYAGIEGRTFDIVPKSVVVTVDSIDKTYGDLDPELSYKAEGLLTLNGVEDVLNGVDIARSAGEDAGEYKITLTVDSASNPYYSVTIANEGVLTINPDTTEIVITVKGASDTVEYSGKEHTVQGYEIASSYDAYSLDLVNFKGDSVISATDAKAYSMGLAAANFENTSSNYSNVVFDVTDGNLVITQKAVTLTVVDVSKTYGKKDPKLRYHAMGLVSVDGVKDQLKDVELKREKGEDVGEYAIKAVVDSAANANYALTIVNEGVLTINPDTTEIVVTVKGHTDTVVYNGKKQTVHGFDMTSDNDAYSVDFVSYKGDSLASGTKVKTYAMGLVAKDFENTSANYTNVVFEIEDGSLTIKKEEKKESKKDALLASRISADLLKVSVMDRHIQVNSSMIGKRYAVYDMQGVVVQLGRVNAASFEIPVSKAGVYMVRVGSQTQRVNVR